jgi:hypothetical protein
VIYDLTNSLELHLWIVLLFFAHGTLLVYVARGSIENLLKIDALAVLFSMGFSLSLLLNFLLLAVTSFLGLPLQTTFWALLGLDVLLISTAYVRYRHRSIRLNYSASWIWLIVAIAFVLMINNGGLVDYLADSWWHMSYANKMMLKGTVFLDTHHFGGYDLSKMDLAYEPAWHSNLALLAIVSDYPLPFIWHSLGAWCFCVALVSYYLLVLALTENKALSCVSVIIFIVLFGGINSYARVAPWPGNVSYSVFYLSLVATFVILNNAASGIHAWEKIRCIFKEQTGLVVFLVSLLSLIAVTHVAELVWYVSSLAFYSYMLWIISPRDEATPASSTLVGDSRYLSYLWILYIAALAMVALDRNASPVFVLSVTLSVVVITITARILLSKTDKRFTRNNSIGIAFVFIAALLTIDYQHLADLFSPNPMWDSVVDKYVPKYVVGYFGEKLRLPHWDHQLRAAVLFGGVSGVIAAFYILAVRRDRATVFFCGNAIIAFIVILSPYLFTYIGMVLPVDRVYRFHTLIFSPVILAILLWISYEKSTAQTPDQKGMGEEA